MCTEQTFAWLSQYKKIYVQRSRHTISSFTSYFASKCMHTDVSENHFYQNSESQVIHLQNVIIIFILIGVFFVGFIILTELLHTSMHKLTAYSRSCIWCSQSLGMGVQLLWTTWVSWVSGDPSDCQIMTGYHVGRYCNYGHSMLGSVDCTGTGCKTCKQNQTSGNYMLAVWPGYSSGA